jgi:deoxyribodipyrimidine photo-lyase
MPTIGHTIAPMFRAWLDMNRPLQIVWFKRDLRIVDHRPLAMAAEAGPVLPLYIAEPELWALPDASARQWEFAAESLAELQADLAALGQSLCVMTGDALSILQRIHGSHGIAALWSHEETGNGWTYARDLAVASWVKAAGIAWHEPRQFGVIRRLKSRNGWAKAWDRDMTQPITIGLRTSQQRRSWGLRLILVAIGKREGGERRSAH